MAIIGGYDQVYTPRIFLKALNSFSADIIDHIVSFEYSEDPHKMDMVSLLVSNPDFRFSDDPRFKTGVGYDMRWGYEYDLSEIKQLVIARAICTFPDGNNMPSVKLEAGGFQKLMNLTAVPRNYGAVSSSAIAKKIAESYGLKTQITDSKDARKQHRVQGAEITDFQFLSGLAKKLNWEFYIENGTLYFQPFQFDRPPSADLVFAYREDARGTLLSFEPGDDKKPGLIGATGTDPRKGTTASAENKTEVKVGATRDGKAAVLGLNTSPEDRAAALPSANTRPGSPTKVQGKGIKFATPEESDTLLGITSEAVASQMRLSIKKATATFIGSPRIRARKVIRIYNVGPYSGNWLITATTHRITAEQGYVVTATLSKASDEDASGNKKKAGPPSNASEADPRVIFGVPRSGNGVQLLGLEGSPDKR